MPAALVLVPLLDPARPWCAPVALVTIEAPAALVVVPALDPAALVRLPPW